MSGTSIVLTTAAVVVPALTRAGHLTISGTRMPPSYSQPFPSRNGPLYVAGVLGPSVVASPPLSELKITSVFSVEPQRVQLRHDAADALVHALDHRRIDRVALQAGGLAASYLAIRSGLPTNGVWTA